MILTVQLFSHLFIWGTVLQQFGRSSESLSSAGKQQIKMLPKQCYAAVVLQGRRN